MLNKDKIETPDIKGEMDEFQRTSQDLKRNEKIDISVDELVKSFDGVEEQVLVDNIWSKLENTESNEIEKGDMKSVYDISKRYDKTNPDKLMKIIKSGDYKRPLILKLNGRYILIAGNTRLSTAAAMGIKPKVFIGKINMSKDLDEKKPKKMETKESMGADSAGAFSAPAFGNVILKKDLYKQHNIKKYNVNEEEEFTEVTAAFSSGAYDAPFGNLGKNPLKIDGVKSIKNSRAVKDKNFPKWGGPDSVFIKIKDKCKKFPYCNQGDINAIELLEMWELKVAINETSKKYGIPYKEIEKIVLNEINKIFI